MVGGIYTAVFLQTDQSRTLFSVNMPLVSIIVQRWNFNGHTTAMKMQGNMEVRALDLGADKNMGNRLKCLT